MSVVAKLRAHVPSSSYTNVADELVADALARLRSESLPFTQHDVDKNIRRRVYDALNVLASMGFVTRSGKHVAWKGVDGFMRHVGLRMSEHISCQCAVGVLTCPQHRCARSELQRRREERDAIRRVVEEKRRRLRELRGQEACLQRIVTRNAARDLHRVTTRSDVSLTDGLEYVRPDSNHVDLPFVMVSAASCTSIEMEMDEHKEEAVFRFNGPFCLHDGYSIVGRVCEEEGRGSGDGLAGSAKGGTWRLLYNGHESMLGSAGKSEAFRATCQVPKVQYRGALGTLDDRPPFALCSTDMPL